MQIVNQTPFAVETVPAKAVDGHQYLTVIAKATFTMEHRRPCRVDSEQIPVAFGDVSFEPESEAVKLEADTAPFKPRADIILVGHAHAPRGNHAVTGIDVAIRVGSLHRVLRVFGDRFWQWTRLWSACTTRPVPFAKMPIVYDRAYGGIDQAGGYCRKNPIGRGYFSKPSRKSVRGAPLPNIEHPSELIRSPRDNPRPVGFGYYGRGWEPRLGYLGTFDETWRLERSPELPSDFSENYYNAAHPDMQVDGYLKGDEPVELRNLSPEGRISFNLPAVAPTCAVDKSYDTMRLLVEENQPRYAELASLAGRAPERVDLNMNLDTLCLLPDEKRFFLIWRGRTPVFDATALEIQCVRLSRRTVLSDEDAP